MKHTKIVLVTLITVSSFFGCIFSAKQSSKKDAPLLTWDEIINSSTSPDLPPYRHTSYAIIKSLIDPHFPNFYNKDDKDRKFSLRNFKKLVPNYWPIIIERINCLELFITSEKCQSLKTLNNLKKTFPSLLKVIDSNADKLVIKSKEINDLLKNDSSKRLENNTNQYLEMSKIIQKDLLATLNKIENIDVTAENYATKVTDIFKELKWALEIYNNYTRIHFEIALTICKKYLAG